MDTQAAAILLVLAIGLLVYVAYRYMNVNDIKPLPIVEAPKKDNKTAEVLIIFTKRIDDLQVTVEAQAKLLNTYHQEIDQAQDHMAKLRHEVMLYKEKKLEIELVVRSPIPVRPVKPKTVPDAKDLMTKINGQLKGLSK